MIVHRDGVKDLELIEECASVVSRYRFFIADGPPDNPELDRLWNDYAHPPTVEIE